MTTRNPMFRSRHHAAVFVASALALGTAVAAVPQAFAHAGLTSTSPARGATVKALPSFVKITFSEPIGSVTSVRLKDAKGRDHVVTAGLDPRNAARVVARTTRPVAGTYVCTWSIVSDDGHRETGTFRFRVRK
jgi:hypothetical protein